MLFMACIKLFHYKFLIYIETKFIFCPLNPNALFVSVLLHLCIWIRNSDSRLKGGWKLVSNVGKSQTECAPLYFFILKMGLNFKLFKIVEFVCIAFPFLIAAEPKFTNFFLITFYQMNANLPKWHINALMFTPNATSNLPDLPVNTPALLAPAESDDENEATVDDGWTGGSESTSGISG